MPIDASTYAKREALFLLQEDLLAKIAETRVAERALTALADAAAAKGSDKRPGSTATYLAMAIAHHTRGKANQLREARLAMENNRSWYRNRLIDVSSE